MIIAIAHSKGGVGKSTIAFNIAVELKKHFKTELVDLDFQQTITHANSIRAKYNLDPIPIITFKNISEYKEYVMLDNDEKISVVDVGGFDSELNRLVILTSDIVITPVSASGRELLGLKRFQSILEEMSNKVKNTIKVHILLNNINPNKIKLDPLKRYISKSDNFILFESILRKRADFDYSMDEGKNVIEYNKNSKASKELKALINELKTIVKDNK